MSIKRIRPEQLKVILQGIYMEAKAGGAKPFEAKRAALDYAAWLSKNGAIKPDGSIFVPLDDDTKNKEVPRLP